MFNGKNKAITFSYDDGVTQDIRLIELFNKYIFFIITYIIILLIEKNPCHSNNERQGL